MPCDGQNIRLWSCPHLWWEVVGGAAGRHPVQRADSQGLAPWEGHITWNPPSAVDFLPHLIMLSPHETYVLNVWRKLSQLATDLHFKKLVVKKKSNYKCNWQFFMCYCICIIYLDRHWGTLGCLAINNGRIKWHFMTVTSDMINIKQEMKFEMQLLFQSRNKSFSSSMTWALEAASFSPEEPSFIIHLQISYE